MIDISNKSQGCIMLSYRIVDMPYLDHMYPLEIYAVKMVWDLRDTMTQLVHNLIQQFLPV